ncbi:glycosyltransferase family 9 protein [Elusimicrobiota bacterium]
MNILLIRYSSLGDVILTTPVARNIKNSFSEAEIDILTKDEYAPVFENNHDVSGVISGIYSRKKYDYIIDLHDSIRSNIIKYFIPAEKRITYKKDSISRRMYLHSRIKDESLNKTVVERYNDTLAGMGIVAGQLSPKIFLTEAEKTKAAELTQNRPYVVLAPGARWRTKEWTQENYLSFMIKIVREFKLNIVITGSESDKELVKGILQGVGLLKKYMIDLTAKTGLREFFAVISGARALVTTDSAAMHAGWALGVGTVALYGPTVKEFGFQPVSENVRIIEKDMKCRPCSLHGSAKCKYHDKACMQRIEVHDVIAEIKKILQDNSIRFYG